MTTHHWTSTDDQGQTAAVVIEERHGLVHVTDEVLADLMQRSGIRKLAAGRSPDLPGINFIRYPDLEQLLTHAGMQPA